MTVPTHTGVSQSASLARKGYTIVSAYLIYRKGPEVCLLLRKNTGYFDGYYGLISGHVEPGECATHGMIREAEEEAGLRILPSQLRVAHIMHRKTERFGIDIFFECDWCGVPENREPEKCESLGFFPVDKFPSNTIPYVAHTLEAVSKGRFYSELGWG